MSLTDSSFSKLSLFGRIIKSVPIVGSLARLAVDFFVDMLSWFRGWNFPQKFPWDWRLEMILDRYEKETTDLFKRVVRPGMTVLDIGAHIGYFTRLCSRLVGPRGRVIAFDADGHNFGLLEKNLAGPRYKNAWLVNKAISDKVGAIAFYNVKNKTGCHSVIKPTTAAEKTEVPSTTVDNFLEEAGIGRVDIIKIDIEGAEYIAFLGMRKLFLQKEPLSVLCEYCPKHLANAGQDPIDFLEDMEFYGFTPYEILAGGKLRKLRPKDVRTLPFYEMGYTNIFFKKE